ncbi:MAG: tetratricopeptide repeat protein [Burkholderiales bacterium]|nr:tetratricopeptide repeat protein [Burkholderiales bacterium]
MSDSPAEIRAALARGDVRAARTLAEAMCAHRPESPEAWLLLGAACHRCGDATAALAAFERAAVLAPEASVVANARATVLVELGRPTEARSVLEAALARGAANDPQLLTNLGMALERTGAIQAAEARYRESLEVAEQSGHPVAVATLMNLGTLLLRDGRAAAALPFNREVVIRAPALADGHFNLAENCLALGQPDEARSAAESALRIDSRHVFARIDLAFALALLDRLPQAQAELARAKAEDPVRFAAYRSAGDPDGLERFEGADARLLFIHWHYQRLVDCDWSRRERFLARCSELIAGDPEWPSPLAHVAAPYRMLALPLAGALHAKLARDVGSALGAAVRQEGIGSYARPVTPTGRSRLRIGYVSPDYRRHPTAHLTRAMYAAHDRRAVEIVAYSLHPGEEDSLTREIESGFDAFHRVASESTADLVQRIRADDIDVLVDLAGYTTNARLEIFAARAAPVQVTWLGVPWTTGIENMDYAFVDRGSIVPGTEHWWSEQLVYLPGSCYVASPVTIDTPAHRDSYGIPPNAFVFCCLCNTWKIEPRIFSAWMRILDAVPSGILWLVGTSAAQMAHIRAEAERAGIDPNRIVFASLLDSAAHLARYLVADLFLDTHVYNGHTTVLDALQAGLPVLTCPGEMMTSRVAANLLQVLGVGKELVVTDLEAYVARAVVLAENPVELKDLRSRIAAARTSSAVFDPERHARTLERAFAVMVQRSRNGEAPKSFDV